VHRGQEVYEEAVKGLGSKTNKIKDSVRCWLILCIKEFSSLIIVVEGSKFSSYMSAVLMKMKFRERGH